MGYINMNTLAPEDIKQITKEGLADALKEFRNHGLIKPIHNVAFQKTEKVLYGYRNLKNAIAKKTQLIESIKADGLKRSSTSIVSYSAGTAYEVLTDAEKAADKIEAIRASISELNGYIEKVDAALLMISDEPHYDIIRMKYLDGATREDISFELSCDVGTVTRNKNRLINILKIYLFPEDSITELFQ